MRFGWVYKTGETVKHGDKVGVSKKLAKQFGADTGEVVGLSGFVSVNINKNVVDVDMRMITFISRKDAPPAAPHPTESIPCKRY